MSVANEELIRAEDLTIKVDGNKAVKNLSFSLKRGERIVFFGTENSGIGSILVSLMGFEKDITGDIFFMGRSIRDFDYLETYNYRSRIGYVHQGYGLISNMSVEANIGLPLQYHSNLMAPEIKSRVNHLIDEMNLDYCKKNRPIDLSPSESLRTAYARAIALDPDVLFLQHILEGQSPLNVHSFREKLSERAADSSKSMIFVTFRPEKFLEISDRFVMFFAGRVVFEGNRDEFLGSDNLYIKQYRERSAKGPMVIL